MLYNIYQISLNKEDRDQVNEFGWGIALKSNPRVKAYLDAKDENFQAAFDSGYYKLVGRVHASNLDEVFEIGNIRHNEVEKLDKMHSISVGDVIQNATIGDYYAVAGVGFEELEA